MNTLYNITVFGFAALTFLFGFLLIQMLSKGIQQTSWTTEKKQKIKSRIITFLILWLLVVSVASLSGFAGNFNLFPFNIGPLLIAPLVIILIITFSKNLADILQHISYKEVIRLQVFRLFVEILLWMFFIQNIVPVQMTFEGRNFDVISGITAPIVAYLIPYNRKFLIGWNILCLGLLINIVTVAVLSMPTPFRVFDNEPANTIVAQFPVIFLPTFLVPLAYTLSFFSLKQLWSSNKS
jgi:hypothetical protein